MLFGKKSGSNIDMMIVGLGNPESKYDNTRHNTGFMVIDEIAEQCGVRLSKMKFRAIYNTAEFGGKNVLLVKPQTYMNNSGEAVRDLCSFYKVAPENTLIVFDDISLDVGALRIRKKGSHGGHNGMKSIVELTGCENYPRIKMGVGKKPHPDYDLAAWVLSKFTADEREPLKKAVENATSAAKLIAQGQTDRAMNLYNS